jgi:hypothetical protein
LLLLERQVFSPDALRKIHKAFVEIWAEAFRSSSTLIHEAKIIPVARMTHAIIGFVHSSSLKH